MLNCFLPNRHKTDIIIAFEPSHVLFLLFPLSSGHEHNKFCIRINLRHLHSHHSCMWCVLKSVHIFIYMFHWKPHILLLSFNSNIYVSSVFNIKISEFYSYILILYFSTKWIHYNLKINRYLTYFLCCTYLLVHICNKFYRLFHKEWDWLVQDFPCKL